MRDNFPPILPDLAIALGAAGIGIAVALALHAVAFRLLRRLAEASESQADDIALARLRRPTRAAMAALGVVLAARELPLLAAGWDRVAGFVMPALIGWIMLAVIRAFVEIAALPAEMGQVDELAARRRRTRLAIFSRIASFIIITITVGLMLFAIPAVREIGVTLLASAGLGALAVGAAAQPALKSLIAGLQMALTEPIRIDDLVTIDGESGRVEDIRATYVIVRLWDERRLIVPSARFLDTTFVTAIRQGSASIGTVMLFVRPEADIAAIRAAFLAELAAQPGWDRRKGAADVTNTTVDTTELRLTMSAADPASLFALRCTLREAMLAWLAAHQPEMIGPPPA